jgi:hypothetical protein
MNPESSLAKNAPTNVQFRSTEVSEWDGFQHRLLGLFG